MVVITDPIFIFKCTLLLSAYYRTVPITKATGDILNKYIHEFNFDKPENQCKQLFENKFNHSFTREGVTYTLQKYATIAHQEDTSIPPNISPYSSPYESNAFNTGRCRFG